VAPLPASAEGVFNNTPSPTTCSVCVTIRPNPVELNEDTLWHGCERIGSELALSPSHVDRYFRLRKLVLRPRFPCASVRARKVADCGGTCGNGWCGKVTAWRRSGPARHRDGRNCLPCSFPRGRGRPRLSRVAGENRSGNTAGCTSPHPASGIRPLGGQPAHLSIGKKTGEETVDGRIELTCTTEDSPEVHGSEFPGDAHGTLDFCVLATDGVDRRKVLPSAVARQPIQIFSRTAGRTLLLNPEAHPQMFDGKGNGLLPRRSLIGLRKGRWRRRRKIHVAWGCSLEDSTDQVVAEHFQRFAENSPGGAGQTRRVA